jgi:hypothetical protein
VELIGKIKEVKRTVVRSCFTSFGQHNVGQIYICPNDISALLLAQIADPD